MRMHWTERSIKDYLFRIIADFIAQLENKMEAENISQDELAKRLKITKGRVSQVLNHPRNISTFIFAKYARVLGMKMSIIAYEDSDPENKKGPINSEIFKICWEKCRKPRDFWAFQEIKESNHVATNVADSILWNEVPLEKDMKILESVSASDVVLTMKLEDKSDKPASDPEQDTIAMGTERPI